MKYLGVVFILLLTSMGCSHNKPSTKEVYTAPPPGALHPYYVPPNPQTRKGSSTQMSPPQSQGNIIAFESGRENQAHVGDMVYVGCPEGGDKVVGVKLRINGQEIPNPEFIRDPIGIPTCVIRVTQPGTFQIEVTPLYQSGKMGEVQKGTVVVP